MESPDSRRAPSGPWTSLWGVAFFSLLLQLWLCQFFSFGERVPVSIDVNPSKLWELAYHFPPTGTFQVLNWLGIPYPASPLNPLSLAAAHASIWLFFTSYAPMVSTFALLVMAAFLRELELTRPAALFGGVVYAWQGDLLPFVYPGHYGYITSWPFFALGALGSAARRANRILAYAVISGVSCGIMVGLLTNADRGAISSLLIAALYLASSWANRRRWKFRPSLHGVLLGVSSLLLDLGFWLPPAAICAAFIALVALVDILKLHRLVLCVAVAALVALAPMLALVKGNIEGVKIAGTSNREQTYKLVTQFSLGPAETLTYLVPGFFGWHINHHDGPYWGWIGEWPDWPKNHQGPRNLNTAISTTGTIAAVLALIGVGLVLPGRLFGPDGMTPRQRFYGRVLLGIGFVTLVLSWGWHTPLYRPIFDHLPLMDKWRNPLKWLEMTNFALVVLSAMGAQQLLASLDAAAPGAAIIRGRLAWYTHGWLILLGLGLLVSYPVSIFMVVLFQSEGFDYLTTANIMGTMHVSLFCALVLMALLSVLLRLLWRPEPLRRVTLVNPWLHRLWQRMLQIEHLPLTLALGLTALTVAQLGWVSSQFIQPAPLQALTATNPLLEALRSEGNRVRVAVPTDDPLLRDDLLQNQFAAMNITCLDISAASRIPDDLNRFFEVLADDEARIWFLAGVKNVAVPEPALEQMQMDPAIAANIERADGYTLLPTGSPDVPSHALIVMRDYLAKATFVPGVEFFGTEGAVLKRLKDPAWNPRESVLLQKPVAVSVPPALGPAEKTDEVDLKTYTPTEIEIEVRTTRSGFILVNDQYDPDWKVRVNGHDEPLLRADYILRAVAIPAGRSQITMRYVAHYTVAGRNISAEVVNNFSDGAMLAAWLIAGIALLRRRAPARA